MPDFNKTLTLDVTSHQRKAAEMLNSLAEMMRREINQLHPTVSWKNLRLSEFGPQLNLLTELIQENQPELEVLMDDEDDDQGPPGLEPIPANEQMATPFDAATTVADSSMILLDVAG